MLGRRKNSMMAKKTTIERWLAAERPTDDAVGDLIKDMRDDFKDPHASDWNGPKHFTSMRAMRSFLLSRHACEGALDAVPAAWRRYKQFVQLHPS
jgi:hypothetical protein